MWARSCFRASTVYRLSHLRRTKLRDAPLAMEFAMPVWTRIRSFVHPASIYIVMNMSQWCETGKSHGASGVTYPVALDE